MMLVAIAVLSLVLALPTPPYRLISDPQWVLTLAAVATLLPATLAAWLARRTIEALERSPADPSIGQYRFGRGMFFVQWLTALLHAALITTTSWLSICRDLPLVGTWPLVPGLLASLPLLLGIVLIWIAVYPADRAIREIALETFVLRGKPVQPVWTLRGFVVFNLRHQILIVLIPMLLILGARDLIEQYERPLQQTLRHPFVPDLLLGSAALLVALLAPVLLRYTWVTEPLPGGPLRDQLLVLSRQLRMKCREILVWRSGGMIINAAVMGVLAPLRYVLITDAMIEQMEDRKIEAVFGHEAGHVKRHHIQYFLLFSLVTGCVVTLAGHAMRGLEQNTAMWAMTFLGLLLVFKWGVLFGWISRRFERQADLFGVHTLELTGLPCQVPCAVHGGLEPGRDGQPICSQAALLFGETLHDVAHLNNIPAEVWTWRHGSISERCRVLQAYARDPQAVRAFERSVLWTKLVIVIVAVAATTWVVWQLKLWRIAVALANLVA